MMDEPRDWDREMAEIDKAIAKQPATPKRAPAGPARAAPPPAPLARRLVALTWFWTVLAIILALGLAVWPYDRSCGIRIIFFLGAAFIGLVMGGLGAVASWSHRMGVAHLLSLLAIVWAGVMATREILPRVGYARQSLTWTCPEPPVPAPAPPPAGN